MQKEPTARPDTPLIGTWRLISAKFESSGEKNYPLNEQPEGLLIYDSRGNVALQLMQADRRLFASGDQQSGTPEEIREALEGYVAYFGVFTVNPETGTVTHQVQGSLLPNWIGGSQIRFYKIDNDILTLQTPPIRGGGAEITGVLVWRKEP